LFISPNLFTPRVDNRYILVDNRYIKNEIKGLEMSVGFEVEVWFKLRIQSLRMEETNPPSLSKLRQVLTHYLPERVERALKHMIDVDDLEEWLDLAFKCDVLLRVQDSSGRFLRIATDVTANPTQALSKFKTISSTRFAAARKDLNIDFHWVVLVDPTALPSRDELMDTIYEAADRGEALAIIEV